MPLPIRATFNNLSQLASTQQGDTSIIVKNGGLVTRGKIKSFFTLKSTNRRAGNVLFAAIRQKYGSTVADALAPQMRASREKGKPLSARTVRDILATAAEMSAGIARINKNMANCFVMANRGLNDPRNIDVAFGKFCADKNIDPAAHQPLKKAFEKAILKAAQQETEKILSYEQMSELVHTAGLRAMKTAWTNMQVKAFMEDPVHGAGAAMDAYAARMDLTAQQKEQLGRLVGMALSYQAELAADTGATFNPETMFQDISQGSLPALRNFAYACGKGGKIDAVARDILVWATPDNMVDLCILSTQIGLRSGMAAASLAVQNLSSLREMQPDGLLSRETLWQGCFNEPMPANLQDVSYRDFNDAIFNHLSKLFTDARPGSPTAATDGMLTLASGFTLAKTLASLRGHVALSLADFANLPTLTQLSELGTLKEVETSLAKDIKRRGTHNSLPGYTPTISFTAPGGDTSTVRIQDTTGMNDEDKASYDAGKPSSITRNLVQQARQLCGDNEVQARQVILSMGQSGALLVRSSSPATGIAESEHSPLDIDIRREENGNITMRFHKPDQSPLDMDYTFTITPDGHGVLTDCRIQARQQAAAPAAEA